ncbi:MAG: hypothetical protein IPF42_06200 [Candidatus Microthrix sp.]|nr:hypothetical protein [Candidatus Microthrix sp.]
MMVGEWGVPTPYPGIDRYIAEVLETMEATTSGWAQFNGCFGEGYCTFGPEGEDREQIDQIVQPFARAIAGAPDDHHFDPATRTLRVTFADNDATGPTEIVVPVAKRYPDGWRLDVDETTVEPAVERLAPGLDLISVDVPKDGSTHTLCLTPEEAPQSCAPPAPEIEPAPSTDSDPAPDNGRPSTANVADPLAARFTG